MRIAFPLAVSLLALSAAARAEEPPLAPPELIGEVVLPAQLAIGGVGLGGLSDLAYDPATDSFLAISDDKGEHGPSRLYRLKVTVDGKGRFSSLDIAGTIGLEQPGGGSFPAGSLDGEGLALDGGAGRMFWSSEADAEGRPAIYVGKPDGTGSKALPLPDAYVPAEGHGARENLSFEGMDLTADGRTLVVATENALAQDGPVADFDRGSPSRIMMIDTATDAPTAQYVYMTDPIPAKPAKEGGWADNGVSALATLPDGRMVVVERNYSDGVGNDIRFYVVQVGGATDVNGQDKVDVGAVTPVQKALWFAMRPGDAFGVGVDNLEALAFGRVVDGTQTMLTVSDDNFNRHQATRVKLFRVQLPRD